MPAGSKTLTIDQYTLYHTARVISAVNWIYCFSGGDRVGQILFQPKGQVSQSCIYRSPFYFNLCYEIDRYQDIIETFRYEKPINIYVAWNENNIIHTGYVTTSQEPVGEQEGV